MNKWQPDSLRGLAYELIIELGNKRNKELGKFLNYIKWSILLKFSKKIPEIAPKEHKNCWVFEKIICPTCLKSNLIRDFNITCPFCETNFIDSFNKTIKLEKREFRKYLVGDTFKDIKALTMPLDTWLLFFECNVCNSPMQYFECQYCKEPIDFFASYKKDEIEARRYE